MTSSASLEKMKFIGSKRFWLLVAAVIILTGAGAAYFLFGTTPETTASAGEEPALQTTKVRRGDLRVSATGSGTLTAGTEVDLAFSTSGTVGTLAVDVGEKMEEGQLLAALADPSQLQANLAQKQLTYLKAQQALDSLYENTGLAMAEAYQAVVDAQAAYDKALYDAQRTSYARCSEEVNTSNAASYERAKEELERLSDCCNGSDEWIEAKNVFDTAYANWVYCSAYTEDEVVEYDAALEVAKAALNQAQNTLDMLQQNNGIDADQVALAQAELEKAKLELQVAQEELDGATLTAPIFGTVIAIAAGEGEAVTTNTFITLADLENLQVVVYVDETDMDQLQVGHPAEIVFDAFPDLVFTGEVIQVQPELVTLGGYQLATGLISLNMDETSSANRMLLGLNATIDVISGDVQNALLVPIEALRDLGGEYSVFVQDANGELKLRMVEVGLMDYTYAEILDGLEEGEIVSTGIVQTN
ncbi:MAG: efflux RND transporter periplasmic adaptor subunit [Anaerolineaceae bacterium]|nr:efflux RND transporter periplasmic adaptor subunit [Anaerolineaceae bacterium]